jgi:alanine dehydrogenase
VVILGGGVVGATAAEVASGIGGDVIIATRSAETVRRLSQGFGSRVHVIVAQMEELESLCRLADVVIGAALVAGGVAPKLVSAHTIKAMKPGAVIVDVSIDQGGCIETSHPTTHSRPTFLVDGVVHYCVANMPGAVPRTSTFALNNATRPFILALADKGFPRALIDDVHLQNGLNVHANQITCHAVADGMRLPYIPAAKTLGA